MIEGKLSRNQYQTLQTASLEIKCSLYSSYKVVQESKRKCYPSQSDITVTEYSAEVKLQSLLDHTAELISLVQSEVIKSLTPKNVNNLNFICKRAVTVALVKARSNKNISMMVDRSQILLS